ncbi:ThiF family adenylyltransferase [Miniimonas sp. S16]|uniref:HesA/MoeB/ThiF family protein n=1 Tax=Miniimonas sp. S16 TaxID=2171623 RepID=UPI000D52A24F|nr:ThiF family adenylyltransferase [Miniimonas sp. S16]
MTTASAPPTARPSAESRPSPAPRRGHDGEHRLSPSADYVELTRRNRGFVPARTQRRLAEAVVLVAGCGSTGGAVIEPLARLGVQHLVLADNGSYELNNLNRQHAVRGDLGRNKAVVGAERVLAINPAAAVAVHERGITRTGVTALVQGCDIVIDGVDVTERAGWLAKYALHEAAARLGRPVVSGYDMAGTQYVRVYDYAPGDAPFDGRLTRAQVQHEPTWTLLRRIVPLRTVPVEMFVSARASLADPDAPLSQLVYTSLLFGALASRIVVDLLAGERVRRHTVIDAHHAVRTAGRRMSAQWGRPVQALLALRDLARSQRSVPPPAPASPPAPLARAAQAAPSTTGAAR